MSAGRHSEHNRRTESPSHDAVRAAWAVSIQSVVWTLLTGATSMAIGLWNGSAVLAAFGAVGLVDAIGSAALAYHFGRGLRNDELADHRERFAHAVVLIGLLTVGLGSITAGTVRLAMGKDPEASSPGTLLAAVSLLVLVSLSRRKRRISVQVASPALRSDSHLSAVGAVQASVTLVGTVTSMIGWRWADPCAAIAIGVLATGVGVQTWRAELPPPQVRRRS